MFLERDRCVWAGTGPRARQGWCGVVFGLRWWWVGATGCGGCVGFCIGVPCHVRRACFVCFGAFGVVALLVGGVAGTGAHRPPRRGAAILQLAEWDDLSLTDSQWDTVFASVDAASTADQHYENNNVTMDVEWDDLSLTDSQLDTVFAAADAAEDQQYNDLNDSVCIDDNDDDNDDDDDENKVANLDQLRQTTAKPKKQYIRLRKNLVMVKTAWDFPWGEENNISEEYGTVRSSSSSSSNSNCCSDSYSSHSSDSTDSHYSDSSCSQSEDIYSCNSDHSQFTENGDNIATQDFNVKLKDLLHSYIPHSPSSIQDTQPSSNSSVPMNTQEFNTKWQALLSNNHPPSTQSSCPSSHPTCQIGGGSTDDLPSEDSPSDEDSGAKYYSIVRVRERQVKKFNATAHDYEIQFNDIQPVRGFVQVMVVLQDVFESIISRLTHGISPRDRVRITLESPSLPYQIWLPFSPVQELTVDRVLGEIERVLQSYEEFTLDENVYINFIHVHMPVGAGKKWGWRPVNIARRLKLMKSIIRITNTDELCCARAIVTATAHINRHSDPGWNSVRQGRQEQTIRASELMAKAGISPGPCGHEELDKLQAVLPSHRIHVISDETSGSLAYQGKAAAEHNIYLYHHNNHYDVITSMPAFLQRNYYCHHCHKGYQKKHDHICEVFCKCCYVPSVCPATDNQVYCQDCHRYFPGQQCFNNHKTPGPLAQYATCQIIRRCKLCGVTINWENRKKDNDHNCGEKYCRVCRLYQDSDHLCYIQPIHVKKKKKKSTRDSIHDDDVDLFDFEAEEGDEEDSEEEMKYYFFDFECTQDGGVHVPNLCIVQSESCSEQVFYGPNTKQEFCDWALTEENAVSTFIAHNLQGYDGQFILQYCHENNVQPEVIINGTKIMRIFIPNLNIKFIDSYNFLPVALAQLPDMFELNELHKGYFPHFFNTAENQDYIGPLPDSRYYGPDGMKQHAREKFLKWYEDERLKNRPFNLKQELEDYCRSDVDILRRSCLKFQDIFKQQNGVDPFRDCVTIASACNVVLRKNFLKKDTIGVIPDHGYIQRRNQSVIALQWLEWITFKNDVNIQHVHNGGEKKIDRYWVDGYDEENNTVYEMHGCYYHGCPRCYEDHDIVNTKVEKTMADLYQSTQDKMRFLRCHGFRVIEKWECDFKKEIHENQELQEFVKSLDLQEPLHPRDAFFGGRTNATTLYHECVDDEEIHYVDFTSLYPYVNKYCKYPVKHPVVRTKNIVLPVQLYFGLAKCRVLPPRKLYFPVLPLRVEKKLMFPICRSCADTKQHSPCEHNDEQRSFVGTWTTPELAKAVEKGYKIIKVFEVWHYREREVYNRESHTGGLFTDYINTFLKLKQESSGWPSWCQTEDDQDRYIREYYDREGILLDKTKIHRNPGQRALAKLMLNSMWGKFAQRNNFPQLQYIKEPAELFRLLTSEQHIVNNLSFVNDDMVAVQHTLRDEFVEGAVNTNVVIAAFTTAYARLKLYDLLEAIGERVLYFDTDSVIFVSKPDQYEPPLGDYLGDLTNELDPPSNFITKFVSGGAKNYAFCLAQPDRKGNTTLCKVRGITLNYRNSLDVNFDAITRLVTTCPTSTITVNDHVKIRRVGCNVVSKSESKKYALVYDKRALIGNYKTLPYGY